MLTLWSVVDESGSRNRNLEVCKFRIWMSVCGCLHCQTKKITISATISPILRIYTSHDVFPCKNVPFGGCIDIVQHFGGQMPPKPTFWGYEYAFSSQTHNIFKLLYHQNYCSNSNQNLHSDKDQQILFVGHPNMCPTNPRWHTTAVSIKNLKNRYLLIVCKQ